MRFVSIAMFFLCIHVSIVLVSATGLFSVAISANEAVVNAVTADTIDGADTIEVSLLGYDFAGDATPDVIIAKDTLELAGQVIVIKTDDYSAAADEFSYRFYVIRIIHKGVGEGTKVEAVEFKTYVD